MRAINLGTAEITYVSFKAHWDIAADQPRTGVFKETCAALHTQTKFYSHVTI